MKPKSCLLAITGAQASTGGIAAVNRLVTRALTDLSYEIDVLVLNESNQDATKGFLKNSQKTYTQFNKSKLKFTLTVWKLIGRKSYDLVMVDHINLASILFPVCCLKRCGYTVWLFGAEVFPPRPDWQGKLGMKMASRRLAISEYTRLCTQERFPDLKIRTIDLALGPEHHNLVDPSNQFRLQQSTTLTSINGDRQLLADQVILHVGRMESSERYKGQDHLIKAFPAIADLHPASQVVLVGSGSDFQRLQALARGLSPELQTRIFMPGFISDEMLDQLYKTCFLFAMPSTGEGFGLVYLEAMARAKPCLGGKLDAAQYVIRDGITGVLVDDPRSPLQIAGKIIELLNNPQRARQMGVAGNELVCAHYLFPHFKERLRKALEI